MVSLLLSALKKNEDELYLIPANENYKPIKIPNKSIIVYVKILFTLFFME